MIRTLKAETDKCTAANESCFVEGFPRTKVQALAMQRLRIVPDKIINLNMARGKVMHALMEMVGTKSNLMGSDMENLT